jgi:hypothetical protein
LAREVAVQTAVAERQALIDQDAPAPGAKTPRGHQNKLTTVNPAEPLTDEEQAAIRAIAPTPEQLNDLYVRAWDAMLSVLPQPFMAAALDAVIENVIPSPKA